MISDRLSGSARRHRRAATRHLPFAVAALALAVFAVHIIEQRLSARTTLAEGQEAFRRGDFRRAADRFRSALGIDPASTAVRLRLIAAYRDAGVPDGESLANHAVAKQALEEIARVLDRDPSNRAAMMAAAEINDVDRISIRRALVWPSRRDRFVERRGVRGDERRVV